MASLSDILTTARKGMQLTLASALIASGVASSACSSETSLQPLTFCQIQDNHELEEICGNPYEEGNCNPEITTGCDDNCDGQLDEICDIDGDGYCRNDKELIFEKGNIDSYLNVCPQTFQLCDEFACEVITDCDDYDARIHPGALEECDGYDNNCDLVIDDTFPEQYSVCGDFDHSLDGIGTCQVGWTDCIDGVLDCTDDVPPTAELCDTLDNNCNGLVDDYIDLVNPNLCFYQWDKDTNGTWTKYEPCGSLEDMSLEEAMTACPQLFRGLCSPGMERCTSTCSPILPTYEICEAGQIGGDKICWASQLDEYDVCDGLDNDCDGIADQHDDIDRDGVATCFNDCDDDDPEVYPGHEEIGCDGKDNDCDGIELNGTDEDGDLFSPEGGQCGPVDCDDTNPAVNPAATEICDCIDNNCVDGIDEGLHTETPIDFFVATDCSGSMNGIIGTIEFEFANADIPECFSGEIINMTNSTIDTPPNITMDLVTVEEWQAGYAADIPWYCSGSEPSLNTIAYAACMVPGMETNPTCEAIYLANPFKNDQVWRPDSKKYMIIITDEKSQWYVPNGYYTNFPTLNQEEVAGLVREAGITMDVYANAEHHNLRNDHDNFDPDPLNRQPGFGHLVLDQNGNQTGNLYDLQADVANGSLTLHFEQGIILRYCDG